MPYHFHPDRTSPTSPEGIVWVFGSNLQGIHGAGAAKVAELEYGAVRGCGKGLTGSAYAIPTRDYRYATRTFTNLSLSGIKTAVERLLRYAATRPGVIFFCTRVGCDLAGNSDTEIASFFIDAPENFSFAEEWREFLEPVPAETTLPMAA